MSMKIVGKKYLNSNLYSKLIISNGVDYNLLLTAKVNKNNKFPTIKTDCQLITDTISDYNDSDKVIEIIDYFLRNNTIYKVYEDDGLNVVSTSGRSLKSNARFSDKELVKKARNMILTKFNDDRLNFLDKNTEYKDYVVSCGSCLEYGYYKWDNKIIYVNVLKPNGIYSTVVKSELEFLKEFIKEKSQGRCIDKVFLNEFFCPAIQCGDSLIKLMLDDRAEFRVVDYINDYNHQLIIENRKQLKLGGIYYGK